MKIQEAIARVVTLQHLTEAEAQAVMEGIMAGEATPAQIAAYLVALRMKGETVAEITGSARALRAHARRLTPRVPVVDTCGTGGDGSGTFNISTAAAFVVAGAGVAVAKHGNRSVSSRCGSADVLQALGISLEMPPEAVERCLETVGIGFLFAPLYHPAMRHAAGPRKEIGIRTLFNLLGPLANPAGATAQVLGVYDGALTEPLARVLLNLGARHCLVVHGFDGLDEITLTGPTRISEGRDGAVHTYTLTPEEVGLTRAQPEDLQGGDAQENARILEAILQGKERGPRRDVVVLNAAAGLLVGGRVQSLQEGVEAAAAAIDAGAAWARLEALRRGCEA